MRRSRALCFRAMEDQRSSTDGKQVGSSGSWSEEIWKYSQDGTEARHKEAKKEDTHVVQTQRQTNGCNKRTTPKTCSICFFKLFPCGPLHPSLQLSTQGSEANMRPLLPWRTSHSTGENCGKSAANSRNGLESSKSGRVIRIIPGLEMAQHASWKVKMSCQLCRQRAKDLVLVPQC